MQALQHPPEPEFVYFTSNPEASSANVCHGWWCSVGAVLSHLFAMSIEVDEEQETYFVTYKPSEVLQQHLVGYKNKNPEFTAEYGFDVDYRSLHTMEFTDKYVQAKLLQILKRYDIYVRKVVSPWE